MDSADNIDTTSDLRAECQQLRKEVARLYHVLRKTASIRFFHLVCQPIQFFVDATDDKLSTEQKIELFRSLFRGREDVYGIRWQGPNRRQGYPSLKTEVIIQAAFGYAAEFLFGRVTN